MTAFARFLTGFARFVVRAFVAVLGAVFALVGLLLVLGVGLFGVAVALVLVAWARLRGRPAPPVRFQWRQAWVRRGQFTRSPREPESGGRPSSRGGEVVDVEFTERREPETRAPERLR